MDDLRKLAEAATPGPWRTGSPNARCKMQHSHGRGECRYTYDGWWESAHEVSRVEQYAPDDVPDGEKVMVAGAWDYEYGGIRHAADTAYIAACSPDRILKLLDALDAALEQLELVDPNNGATDTIRAALSGAGTRTASDE